MDQTSLKRLSTWFCRITVISGIGIMVYAVLLPQYNFSHWMPHGFLKGIGVPYSFQLWLDHNMDKMAHFFGAIYVLTLLYGAKFFLYHNPELRFKLCAAITLALVVGAEIAQKWIERGFSFPDIVVGVIGVIIASLLINKTKLGKILS